MKNTYYFEKPTQVMFADPDRDFKGDWCAGIAYQDEVICLCCGGIFNIEDIYENTTAETPIYPYKNWVNLAYDLSEELPKGLSINDKYEIVEDDE